MPKVIILRGLPGSGKSTWAKDWVNKAPNQRKRINKDLLREMLDFGNFTSKSESFIIEARDNLIVQCIENCKDIVIDDTNLNPVHEDKIRELVENIVGTLINCDSCFPKYEIERKDFLDVPVEECIKRDLTRLKSVGKDVIMEMYNKYVKPKDKQNERENYKEFSEGLRRCVICDIDGTIANNNGHRGWHDYHKVGDDTPIMTNIRIVAGYLFKENIGEPKTKLIFMSGRQDSCKEETYNWLNRHVFTELHNIGIEDIELYMRKTGDFRKDSIVKEELYREHIEGKYNVEVIFDDRNQVVDMWRSLGLRCFQVANGDF